MQQCFDRTVERTFLHCREKFVLVQIIRNRAIDKISETVSVREVVDRDDVSDAARIERLDEIRADETCCTGNYINHCLLTCFLDSTDSNNSSGWTTAVPNLPTTMPAARLAT